MENVSFTFFSENDYVGASLVDGARFDQQTSSVAFDGNAAHIKLPSFLIGGEGSWSFICKFDDFANWSRLLDASNPESNEDRIIIANKTTTNELAVILGKDFLFAPNFLVKGVWVHIVLTIGSTGHLRLYRDGSPQYLSQASKQPKKN